MRYLKIVLLAALLASAGAHARCTTRDPWTGPDKAKHLAVGAVAGSAVTLATKRPEIGFLAGTALGIAKEVADSRAGRVCSLQDAVVTAAGAWAGAYGTALVILPKKDGVHVVFAKAF